MLRKRAVHLETEPRGVARESVEHRWRDETRDAAPSIQDETERTNERGVDEREHVVDVVLEEMLVGARAAGGDGVRDRPGNDHVPDLRDAGVAAQGERGLPDELHAVVLLRVMRCRDLRAAVVAVPGHRVVQHVGAHQAVVGDVGPLGARASR